MATYSANTAKQLFVDSAFDSATGKKDYIQAKAYMEQHFYPLSSGDYLFVSDSQMVTKNHDTTTRVYLNRVPKVLKQHVLTDIEVYDPVCIPNKPFLDGNKINLIAQYKHTINNKSYADCTRQQKEGVQMMIDMLKTVWASGNDDSLQYLLKWFANMLRGNKNQSLLYLKSTTEGIGKSTFTTFMMDHVLGKGLSIESNSDPLRTKYNKILFGKLLVVFEELEKSSQNEWETISKKLKCWVTSDKIIFENKFENSFESNNISNYIVLSNREAIKHSDGRRYFTLDLSTKYKGDTVFWNKLHTLCFNDAVGEAFAIYLSEIDLSNFNSSNFPILKSKTEAIIDRIHPVFKMLKFNWILLDKNFKCSVKELYGYMQEYMVKTDVKFTITKRSMVSMLREIGIEYKSSNSKSVYNVSIQDLKLIATKFKWYSEFDKDELEDNYIFSELQNIEYKWISAVEYNNMIDKIAKLESQLNINKHATKNKKKHKTPKKLSGDTSIDFDAL
jgi:hypothetical protein